MAAISPNMFSVVVFMSMVTTILAPFLLMWAFKRRYGTCDPNGQVEQSDVSG
jgi:Kef-type K+ transport system membrane component KefB